MNTMSQRDTPEISIVIPVHNEQDNVVTLFDELTAALESIPESYEIIYVDDGSTDDTLIRLEDLSRKDDRLKIVILKKNFGQTPAMSAGFDHAQGNIIVTLDGDLQNVPSDIPALLKTLDEGYDVISGWRYNRQDHLLTRKIPSVLGNWLISRFTGVRLHDYGCTLKAYRRDIIQNIRLYGKMHQFLPAIAHAVGAKIKETTVTHRPRIHGRTKSLFILKKFIGVILNLMMIRFFLYYASNPIQYFGRWGIVTIASGLLSGTAATAVLFQTGVTPTNNPSVFFFLLLSVIFCTVGGFLFIALGLTAEMLMRTYHETQHKPIYVVKKTVNFPQTV